MNGKTWWRGVLVAGFLAALFTLSRFSPADDKAANDGVITHWGKPKNYSIGKVNGFWVWYEYDDGFWVLRTTGGGKGAHRFVGEVAVADGVLSGLKGIKGEASGTLGDTFVYNASKTAIRFDFRTDQGVDGFNFTTSPGSTALKFTLSMDGQPATKVVRVGRAGDHPATAVFTAPAHPAAPPAAPGKAKGKKK
jgi:hypothetical protein